MLKYGAATDASECTVPVLSVKLHTLQSCKDMRDLFQNLHHLFKGNERAARNIIFIFRCLCYCHYTFPPSTQVYSRSLWVFRRLQMRITAEMLTEYFIRTYIHMLSFSAVTIRRGRERGGEEFIKHNIIYCIKYRETWSTGVRHT